MIPRLAAAVLMPTPVAAMAQEPVGGGRHPINGRWIDTGGFDDRAAD